MPRLTTADAVYAAATAAYTTATAALDAARATLVAAAEGVRATLPDADLLDAYDAATARAEGTDWWDEVCAWEEEVMRRELI